MHPLVEPYYRFFQKELYRLPTHLIISMWDARWCKQFNVRSCTPEQGVLLWRVRTFVCWPCTWHWCTGRESLSNHCHLEFASPVWSPWHNQNIEILDKKRSWKVWSNWGLKINLRDRYTISSWQEVKSRSNPDFEILEGIDDVDSSTWFTAEGHERQRLTRNTAYLRNLVAARSKTGIILNFSTNRILLRWSGLPTDVKEART